jgi:hypothetical protein
MVRTGYAFVVISILWGSPSFAQAAVGGPRETQSVIGGPTRHANPVVPPQRGKTKSDQSMAKSRKR